MSIKNFHLYRPNGKIMSAKPSREGLILFSNIQTDDDLHTPYICIQNRGSWIWDDIQNLSGERFKKSRLKIRNNLSQLFKNYRKEINSHNVTKRKLKNCENINSKSFEFMYNKMNPFEREEFLTKFPNFRVNVEKNTCTVCNNISSNFKKCRHKECTKMCETCHTNWKTHNTVNKNGIFVFGYIKNIDKDTCPACHKSQLYECPICYECKDLKDIIKSDNCDHYICQGCFCNSFMSNPIVDCPLCRKQFKRTLSKTTYNDGMPEDSIIV